MGSDHATERKTHQAGGPGKASKQEHAAPEKSRNKPGQLQTPKDRGGGEGGARGAHDPGPSGGPRGSG
jgi:hypothetical protein